jgi:hypothetical protein
MKLPILLCTFAFLTILMGAYKIDSMAYASGYAAGVEEATRDPR